MRILKVICAFNKKALFVVLAIGLVACVLPIFSLANLAFATTEDTEDNADALQQKVEESASRYDELLSENNKINSQIEDINKQIEEVSAKLPSQIKSAESAVKQIYYLDTNMGFFLNWILGIESPAKALENLVYIGHIRDRAGDEIQKLKSMKVQLSDLKAQIEEKKKDSDNKLIESKAALDEAKAAREQAKRRAEEQAEREKQEALAALKVAEEQNKNQEESKKEPIAPPNNENIDWSADKQTFVAKWAPRIDAYLAGYPLAGQGKTFAIAAWENGVDPRWSPAISNTESTRGLNCFLPYNAWGWGRYSYSSWEEAINSHVRGLKRGYGYTISVQAAKKYCPPNWQHWYAATSAQMNMI